MHKYLYFLFNHFLLFFRNIYLAKESMSIQANVYIRPIAAMILFLGICFSMQGQTKFYEEDVLYLKNGSVLRGEIIKQEVGEYVKIRLHEGIEFIYKTSEIEKIKREAAKFTRISLRYHSGFIPVRFQEKGLFYTQITYGLAINETEERALANFTGQIRSLYHAHHMFNVGAGTGLDFYEGGLVIPFFAEVQGDFLKKRITPYYALQGGYGIGAIGTQYHTVFEGGLMGHAALGVHWYTGNKRSYFLSLGYKTQRTYQEFRKPPPDLIFGGGFGTPTVDPPLVIGERGYRKVVIQFGYTF